jgi:hypothetical protein
MYISLKDILIERAHTKADAWKWWQRTQCSQHCVLATALLVCRKEYYLCACGRACVCMPKR